MKENTISDFLLERYRLGEITNQDKETIEELLVSDCNLQSRLKNLEESDRELRLRYNGDFLKQQNTSQFPRKHFYRINLKKYFLIAAVLVCVFLPAFYLIQNTVWQGYDNGSFNNDFQTDRVKGHLLQLKPELYIYLKDGGSDPVADFTVLEEGCTIQLAYYVPAGTGQYGVIFSIDGRSHVTLHYPFRLGLSPELISGKRTLLNRAYILDDAPEYEIFVFVVSPEPLNVPEILEKAGVYEKKLKEKNKEIFDGFNVEIITILKKEGKIQ